nr:MAG TPA: Nuclease [Caudoviricetes sp.]
MTEKDIEEYLRLGVKKLGGVAFKFTSPGNSGVPDRLIVMPGNRIYFVELKRPGGRTSPLQNRQISRLKDLGCRVLVVDSKESAERFLNDIQSS